MKKLYVLLFTITLSSLVMSQYPCPSWNCCDTPPATVVNQVSETCYRIPINDIPPQFNVNGIASIDEVWSAASIVPIAKQITGMIPDPDFKAISKFMYDTAWMYILVIVSGDLEIDKIGNIQDQDHVRLMFQNTRGGKGTVVEHCYDTTFANWYWEQDGDKVWWMPAGRATMYLEWLDQDVDDICGGGEHNCSDVTGDSWLEYANQSTLLYNVYTSADTIIYEMAYHLRNWMKYSFTDVSELEGHKFGFDFSIRDIDGLAGLTNQINLNDPENNAYAWTTVLADFTFGEELTIGIEDHQIENISISPNPVSDILTIESLSGISNISVLSITGQKLMAIDKPSSNRIEIDISSLNNAIYFLNIQMEDNRMLCKKVVKY